MYINNLKGKYVQHLLSVDDMSEDFILEIWTNALKNKEDLHPNENDALNALIIAETAMKSANLNKSLNIEYHY